MRCWYCSNKLEYGETYYKVDGDVVCDDCIRTEQFSDIKPEDLDKIAFRNYDKGDEEIW